MRWTARGRFRLTGQLSCTVTVERIRSDGEPAAGEGGTAEVFPRATGGMIMDSRGARGIRSVRPRRGRALRLVSDEFPRFVVVHAFRTARAGCGAPTGIRLAPAFRAPSRLEAAGA
jgi:hypothetical protein